MLILASSGFLGLLQPFSKQKSFMTSQVCYISNTTTSIFISLLCDSGSSTFALLALLGYNKYSNGHPRSKIQTTAILIWAARLIFAYYFPIILFQYVYLTIIYFLSSKVGSIFVFTNPKGWSRSTLQQSKRQSITIFILLDYAGYLSAYYTLMQYNFIFNLSLLQVFG